MAEKSAKKVGGFRRFFRGIGRFFGDIRGELKRVSWPTARQVWNNLLVVLGFVLLSGLLIFGLDTLFGWLLQFLLGLASGGGDVASSESLPIALSILFNLPL